MRIAGDFFFFEPRGSLAFEDAGGRGISESVVVRGGGNGFVGSEEGDVFNG